MPWGSLHSLPPSNPLIAINGPDTWAYYRIQIVIYDVRLTAHELTSGGVTVGHDELRVAECHYVHCHVFYAFLGTISSAICSASLRNEGPQSHQSQFDVCEGFF